MTSTLLPLVVGLVVLALASPRVQAADQEIALTQGIELVPASNPIDPAELDLFQTYVEVRDGLLASVADPIRIPLEFIPGFQLVEIDTVTVSVSDEKHAIAIRGDGTLLGEPVSALLTADWGEGAPTDATPDLVLGVKFTNVQLDLLNPAWTDLGDDVPPTFTRAWVAFSNATGLLDVEKLPQLAATFYELSGPASSDGYDLVAGANFRGFLDLNLYPALRKALAFHGVQTQEILIEGHLAASAALLFDAAGPADLGELDLSTTIDTTGPTPPAWLTERALTIGLSLDPGPVIELGDTIDTLIGDAANEFTQSISFNPLDFAGPGPTEISGTFDIAGALERPFGIEIGDASLELTVGVDLSAPAIITSIDAALLADLDVGLGTVGARIGLEVDGPDVGVHVVLDNHVSLSDVVNAFTVAVDLPSFDTSAFGDLTLETVSFDIARIGGNTEVSLSASLGAWDNVFGLGWLDLDDLTVAVSLADGEMGGPAFAEPRFTASLSSLFDIGGIGSTLSVDVSGIDGALEAKVRAGLAPGEVIPIGAALDFVLQEFGALPTLGSVFTGLDLDALSMVVSVDTAGAASFDIFASVDVPNFPGASMYLSIANPSTGLSFFAGIRPDGPVSIGDIVPIPGLEAIQLPDLGLVLATADMHVVAADLSAEGYAFLKPLFGCEPGDAQPAGPNDEDGCGFDVDLDAGVNMLANIELPDALDPLTQSLWMDPAGGLQFVGTVPIDLGGTPPTGFSLKMILPTVNPPDKIDMIESGRLAIGVAISLAPSGPPSVSLEISGELQTRWRRSSEPISSSATCALGTKMTGIDEVGGSEVTHFYCYDRLTFDVSAAVVLDPNAVELVLEGGLRATDGLWEQPFGVEWLDIRTLRLQFGVGISITPPSLNFKTGFLGDIVINDKTIATSLSVGLTITPFPPPPPPAAPLITPTFLGFRGYVSSLGMTDLVEIQRMFTGGSDTLGFGSLPDMEIRNAEVMFAVEDNPSLCLELGLGVAGELYIGGEPAGAIDVPTDENGCRPFGELVDPETCQATGPAGRREEGCFASFFGRVSLDGIIADGSVGGLDLGPVHFDNARLNFRLTPALQAFVLSGGVTVDGLGSGNMAVSVKKDAPQFSFYGRLETFDLFFAQVDGSLSVSLAPPFTPVGSVTFHAALEADGFNARLEGLVEDRLQVVHDVIEPIVSFWDDLSDGNRGAVLEDIEDVIASLGVNAPAWADPLFDAAKAAKDAANDAIDAYNVLGHSVGHVGLGDLNLNVILDGGDLKIDVGTAQLSCPIGTHRSGGSCYLSVPPGNRTGDATPSCSFPAQLNGDQDRCRLVIPIPSFGDFLEAIGLGDIGFPTSLDDLEDTVEGLLEDGIEHVTGLSSNFDLDTYFDRLVDGLSDVTVLSVDCAEFSFEAGFDTGTQVNLKAALTLLGEEYGLNRTWSFGGDGFSSLEGLFDMLLNQFLGTSAAVTCVGPADPPAEIDSGPGDDVTLELSVSPTSINEGGQVTLTGTFSDTLDEPTDVLIRWRDGSTTLVTATGSSFQRTHTYADDAPSGTAADTYNVQAFIAGLEAASVRVTVRNVAPVITLATFAAIESASVSEATSPSFTVGFTDPGVKDPHTIVVTWGDGTAQTVRHLAAGVTSTNVSHHYADDNPSGSASDEYPVTVTVSDDDTGSATGSADLTVNNITPSGLSFQLSPTSIAEFGVVVVTGTWADPGLADQHTVVVDWGNAAVPPTTIAIATGQRSFGAAAQYGDNGTFTITVRVTDDDTGTVTSQRSLTVANLPPATAIDESNAINVNGSPTFITKIGVHVNLGMSAIDLGSDDLTFKWDFDTRMPSVDVQATSFVPGQTGPDGHPSPSVHPRLGDDVTTNVQGRAYTEACYYRVGLTLLDDDGGSATDSTNVVVQGLDTLRRSAGYWYNEYKKTSGVRPTPVRNCYLLIAQYMSRVLGNGSDGNPLDVSTFAKAGVVLNAENTPRAKLQRQILAAWLNFANGSFTWSGLVDTDNNGVTDTAFGTVMSTAETVALNPNATSVELLAQKDLLERLNK